MQFCLVVFVVVDMICVSTSPRADARILFVGSHDANLGISPRVLTICSYSTDAEIESFQRERTHVQDVFGRKPKRESMNHTLDLLAVAYRPDGLFVSFVARVPFADEV